jgi:hypothetical protein
MSQNDLTDIQRSLNVIRGIADKAEWQTKLRALELMMATSQSVIAAARKLTAPKEKTVKKTVVVPKVKTQKQPMSQADTKPEAPDLTPIRPKPPVG